MSTNRPIRRTILAASLACLAHGALAAPTMPSSGRGSALYYQLGGTDAGARAPNAKNLSLKLGLSGSARFNYSCGKFSASVSLQNAFNQFKNIGPVLSNAVQAGIAALPMYILQRAQPGLYELVQTYMKAAQELVNLSFQSCEQMEQAIKDGKNPYDKYVSLAMGEGWKQEAATGNDVVTAKENVQTRGGRDGFSWVFGSRAGGEGQPSAKIVSDTVTASYNLTMMQPTTTSPSATYSGSRLAKAFPTAASAATYATDFVGDLEVASCADGGCPPKGTKTSVGLERKVEDEIPIVKAQLATLLAATVPTTTDLDAASAPGVLVTRDLVDALRALPKPEQAIAVDRLGQEVALARTVDRALLVRQMLTTGQTIPEALPDQVAGDLQTKIAEVNRAIDDMLYGIRVRREVVSTSANTLLSAYRAAKAASAANAPIVPNESRPLIDGQVR
jgi:integrating conjugative element protein (TIGR03755 family)